MNGEQIWLAVAAGGAVALVLLVACALLWRSSRRLTARLAELETALAQQSARTPHAAAAPVVTTESAQTAAYVITAIDEAADEPAQSVPARIDGALFADIVARETLIKAAALAHGLRRGLSAETRNRIRFEMKREVKRSRKQRRADLKAALRDHQARDRARMAEDQTEEDAA